MSWNPTFLIAVLAFAAGILVGFLLSKTGRERQLEKKLYETKEEFNNYKESVSSHFGRTAELVNGMTKSYKDVFDHLSAGANLLAQPPEEGLSFNEVKMITPIAGEENTDEKPTFTDLDPSNEDEKKQKDVKSSSESESLPPKDYV